MCDYLAIKKEKTIFYGQKYPGFWKDICYPWIEQLNIIEEYTS